MCPGAVVHETVQNKNEYEKYCLGRCSSYFLCSNNYFVVHDFSLIVITFYIDIEAKI